MSRIYVDRISPYQSASLEIDGFDPTIDTSSLVTTSSFNDYTSSNDDKVNSLINETGSYATTGANTFTDNQVMSGSITMAPNQTIIIGDGETSKIEFTSFDSLENTTQTHTSFGIVNTNWNNQTPFQQCTALGVFSFGDAQANSGSVAMIRNTVVGYQALNRIEQGNNNSVYGAWASERFTDGGGNTTMGAFAARFLDSGSDNTAIGFNAIAAVGLNNPGDYNGNTSVGRESGIGALSGGSFVIGSQYSTFLGSFTKAGSTESSYEIVIGANAEGHGENTTTLGSINQTQETYIIGDTIISGSNGTDGNLTTQGSVNVGQILNLQPQDPLPGGQLGDLSVSGSDLYFNNGTSWSQIN